MLTAPLPASKFGACVGYPVSKGARGWTLPNLYWVSLGVSYTRVSLGVRLVSPSWTPLPLFTLLGGQWAAVAAQAGRVPDGDKLWR